MAIRTNKFFKVYEQADPDSEGCGTIVASFSSSRCGGDEAALAQAQSEAKRLGRENSPRRFYVLSVVSGHYTDSRGRDQDRSY